MPICLSGQIVREINTKLDQARPNLYTPPPQDAKCFFGDPLTLALGEESPKCENIEGLWEALRTGYHYPDVTDSKSRIHLFKFLLDTLQTKVSAPEAEYLKECFPIWMYFWFIYFFDTPTEFTRFQHIVGFVPRPDRGKGNRAHSKQSAMRLVFTGYLKIAQRLVEKYSLSNGQSQASVRELFRQGRFFPSEEKTALPGHPLWIDWFLRLTNKRNEFIAFARSRSISNWSWDPRPADAPLYAAHLERPSKFSPWNNFNEALCIDHWLTCVQRYDLRSVSMSPLNPDAPQQGIPAAVETPKQALLEAWSASLTSKNLPSKPTDRFLPPDAPAFVDSIRQRSAVTELEILEWTFSMKSISREDGIVEISGLDHFFCKVAGDFDFPWLLDIELRLAGKSYWAFALDYEYESGIKETHQGLEAVSRLEIIEMEGLPWFDASFAGGRPVELIPRGSMVRAARVKATGAVLMLLRVNLQYCEAPTSPTA